MYSDAGLGYNNPTMVAVQQTAYHFPGSRDSLRAVISVGTGHRIAREGFDPPISGYKLDDYEKMPEMVAEARPWLKLPDIRGQIVRAARLLSGADGRLLKDWHAL